MHAAVCVRSSRRMHVLCSCMLNVSNTNKQNVTAPNVSNPRPRSHCRQRSRVTAQDSPPQMYVESITSRRACSHIASDYASSASSHSVEWCFMLL